MGSGSCSNSVLFDTRVHTKKLLNANLMLFCLFFLSVDPEEMREKSSDQQRQR